MKAFLFPGQGSQKKGMGAELFPKYPEYVKKADEILGYSIEDLCVSDAQNKLNYTAYTQPAIFVVSVLNYLEALKVENRPGFAAGHSIGEYAALFAAEAFNFEAGLQIVKKRAELMSHAEGGALAAVVGMSYDEVEDRIRDSRLPGIEIANINSPTQIVVGAPVQTIQDFAKYNEGRSGRVIVLKVSGAFHTSHMRQAQEEFRSFLNGISFKPPSIAVIANYTAQPHSQENMASTLANHLANRVRWTECMEYLLAAGVETFTEVGSKILTPMVNDIREHWVANRKQQVEEVKSPFSFCSTFGFSKPLVVGGTGYGAAGVEQVSNLAHENVLAFLDTYRRPLPAVERDLQQLAVNPNLIGKYGVSIMLDHESGQADDALITLCLKYGVRFVEARGYFEPTAALRRYRTEGGMDDRKRPNNRILLRVTNAEMALPFLGMIDDFSCPLIDIVSLDSLSWRSPITGTSDQFTQLLAFCNQVKTTPFGKIFVGLSGPAATAKPVETARQQGADFVLLGSVFMLADESMVAPSVKTSLANSKEEHFREIFDWAYPAFGTISYSHVANAVLHEQVSQLQQLYLDNILSTASLRELAQQYRHAEYNIVSDDFVDACEGMNTYELRHAVRERVRTCMFPHVLYCESPFPNVAEWLYGKGASFPIGAVKLANLIYPTH